jgi:hypothetical protein
VWQAIVVSTNATTRVGGDQVTVMWTLPATAPANAAGCSVISNGQGTFGPTTGGNGSYQATYTSSPNDDGNTVTFTAACPAGASPGIAQVTVTFPIVAVSLNPASVSGGDSTQITWTPPANATGCTLTSNGQGTPNPIAIDNGTTSGSSEPVATYASTATDAQTNGGIVTITAACTAGASPGNAQLTVTPPPP